MESTQTSDSPSPEPVDIGLGIVCHAGEILIARRADEAVLGGLWEFPGGKFRPGESAVDCVVREVAEEVGLQIEARPPFLVLQHQYPHANVRLHCCRARVVGGLARPLGCAEVRWVALADLAGFDFPVANRLLLDHLLSVGEQPLRQ